jgi:hypothetical protein
MDLAKITVRCPLDLQQKLNILAEENGVSLNTYIVSILADSDRQRKASEFVMKDRKKEVSDRLNYILKRISNGVAGRFEISELAEMLKENKSEDFYQYFEGTKEAPFDFLDKLAELFCINKSYLKHGKGTPFAPESFNGELFPLDYYKEIVSLNPQAIWLVRSKGNDNTDDGYTFLFLDLGNNKYYLFNRIYHINTMIGGTGSSQIVSLYKLIVKLLYKYGHGKVNGLYIKNEDWVPLCNGELYPGEIIRKYRQNHSWWQDFIDIYHTDGNAKDGSYENWWGKEFIEAQIIVRRSIPQDHWWEERRKVTFTLMGKITDDDSMDKLFNEFYWDNVYRDSHKKDDEKM